MLPGLVDDRSRSVVETVHDRNHAVRHPGSETTRPVGRLSRERATSVIVAGSLVRGPRCSVKRPRGPGAVSALLRLNSRRKVGRARSPSYLGRRARDRTALCRRRLRCSVSSRFSSRLSRGLRPNRPTNNSLQSRYIIQNKNPQIANFWEATFPKAVICILQPEGAVGLADGVPSEVLRTRSNQQKPLEEVMERRSLRVLVDGPDLQFVVDGGDRLGAWDQPRDDGPRSVHGQVSAGIRRAGRAQHVRLGGGRDRNRSSSKRIRDIFRALRERSSAVLALRRQHVLDRRPAILRLGRPHDRQLVDADGNATVVLEAGPGCQVGKPSSASTSSTNRTNRSPPDSSWSWNRSKRPKACTR